MPGVPFTVRRKLHCDPVPSGKEMVGEIVPPLQVPEYEIAAFVAEEHEAVNVAEVAQLGMPVSWQLKMG